MEQEWKDSSIISKQKQTTLHTYTHTSHFLSGEVWETLGVGGSKYIKKVCKKKKSSLYPKIGVGLFTACQLCFSAGVMLCSGMCLVAESGYSLNVVEFINDEKNIYFFRQKMYCT